MPESDLPQSNEAPTGAQTGALCDLAGLCLTPAELTSLGKDLAQILTYVRLIDAADSSGQLPTIHPTQTHGTLREDDPRSGLSAGDALRNAPRTKDDHFRAPPAFPPAGDPRD